MKNFKLIIVNILFFGLIGSPKAQSAEGLLTDFDSDTLTHVSKLIQAAYPDERESVEGELAEAGWLIATHDDLGIIHATNGPVNVFSYVGTTIGENFLENFGSLAPMAGDDGCAGPEVGNFVIGGSIPCPDAQCDDKYAARFIPTGGILNMIPEADDDAKFIFAGHSMGGAVSQIASLYGCAVQTSEQKSTKNTYVMTFGAPAVFSEDVVEKYNAIFPDSSSMRVEMKGDPIPAFGRGVQAGTSFGLDGGFPDVDVDDFTEGGEFSIAGMALAAHSVAGYVSHFPSLF